MKKIVTSLFLVLCGALCCWAADLDYPCQKLIQKGDYAKAHSEIASLLQKKPQDLTVLYAAACLFSAPDNPNKNIEQAYRYACKGKELAETKKDKETTKLISKGFSKFLFQSAIDDCVRLELRAAKETDTPDAYKALMDKYPKMGSEIRKTVRGMQEAAAFRLAQEENTVVAYRSFIISYSDSKLVERAWWNIYETEYKKLRRLNSRKASTDYLKNYPNSHRCPDVLNELYPISHYENLVDEKSYVLYKSISDTSKYEMVYALLMQRTLTRCAQKNKHLFIADHGFKNFIQPYRDSCWLVLHDIYMDCSSVDKFKEFYKEYKSNSFPDIARHDSAMIGWGVAPHAPQFIHKAAPYLLAYEMMVENIADYIQKGKWDDAIAYCKQFSPEFGDDRRFNHLIEVMEAPVDKEIKREKLSDAINTKNGSEICPIFSIDGQTMYFTASGRRDNAGGEDIFVSTKNKKGAWTKAQLVSPPSTVSDNEAPEAISNDGTEMIFFSSGKLKSSHKTATGWSTPKALPDQINIAKWQADVMLTSDGKAMIFSAKKGTPQEAYISTNIFVSLLDSSGHWTKPIDLGPTINTARQERTAFLHPDMTTLYFSSNGHGGLGGLDVFKSTRLNPNSWTEWSEPVNLGKQVNTVNDDWGYKISTDGTTAFFSSDGDVYSMDMPEDMRPEPVVAISGFVTDNSGKAAKVAIRWNNDDLAADAGMIRVTADDGAYFYVLKPGYVYSYTVNDDNYQPLTQTLDLRGIKQMATREVNIRLTPLKKKSGTQQAVED